MSEERRVVTVLFSDVAGSTAMGESSDPEDVRALLGRYYAIAREVISTHGGTLEKFIGDSVMAVFGIPQAHGDDAERALVAALALVEAVAADPQTMALTLRIGVNTGEVVAARQSEGGDFLVTGDAVNVAARLQQHAEPGAILVGERTRRAVSGFRFGDEQQLAVKGKREPISAAALVERLAESRAPRAPFLGREHDLAQLDLVARRAFSERRPQLVTITAPAGTGKSRLVEEFIARAGPDVNVAVAQCLPYGSAVTFLPLRGLVRDLLGADREEDVLPRLCEAFTGADHTPEDARRLASLIGVTLGDADSERRDREEVFSAWRLLIEALAARGPLVVVFEDLHWASDTLLDLVEHVTVSRLSTPLVMFALARPELLDRKPNWGGGRRNFTSLGLEPLTEGETRRLVAGLTDGVPDAIASRIAERSGGNPFFAGELVRAYEDRRREGTLDADIRLPDTVHATVLARIDGLPAEERSILEYAAVAGRTARAAAIHALLKDFEETRIAAALEALAQRDLLVMHGAGAYTFRHIVIREVAYATLPRAERVRAHLRFAQWLEETAEPRANERAELVAYHYRQAMALSPGGRAPEGLSPAKVVGAFERAARIASNAGAIREAGELLREAMNVAPAEEHLRLLEVAGDLALVGNAAVGGFSEAYRRWRESPHPDPGVGARLLVKWLGVCGRWSGSLTQPMGREEYALLAGEAQRLLGLAPNELLEAKLACALAFDTTRFPGECSREVLAKLKQDTERAAALFASRGDAEAESEALDALACVHRDGYGDPAAAHEATRRRLASADRLGLLERVDAWAVALWDLVYLGRYEEAVETGAQARKSLRAGEPEFFLMHSTAWSTFAAMLCGRWDEALAVADLLLDMREQTHIATARFNYPGFVAAMRIATARMDTTRLARYRSAFVATSVIELLPEPSRPMWTTFIDRDAQAARRALRGSGHRDRKSEVLAFMLFELGERLTEEDLADLERQVRRDPPVMTLRIALAQALNQDDPMELRRAVAGLDAGHLVADAARAATLLALRTKDAADRADAERRLGLLGDRAYLQRLAEDW